MNGWRDTSFGDCARLTRATCNPIEALAQPYIGLEHIVPGMLVLEGHGWGSDVSSTKTRFREGDILFGKLRPYFRKVIRPRFDGVCSTDIWVVRAHDGVDQGFLYYWMASQDFVDIASLGSEGTKMPRAKWDFLARLQRKIPSFKEQRAIASVLGSLDDKIELNRRMNETLEEVARTLFKSWFVDFDPVRTKMEGRQPTGMDEKTAALFPDSFEESALGEIPKGWKIGTLAECTDLNPESWSRNTAPSQITYVDLANTKWGYIEATQEYAWEDAPSRALRILRPGDTIVGTVRPGNGSFSLVAEEGLTGSTGFAVLRPHKAIYAELVYFTATASENIERLSRLADGAAYPAVRPGIVSATQTVQPNEPLIECFSTIVKLLTSRIAANRKEASTLAAIRDTLLPKLLSGEMRVSDAEHQIEEAI